MSNTNQKKTAVAFASSGAYAIGVCTNIMSIEEKSPGLADKYIVFYDGWEKTLMDKLSAFSDKVEFVEYTLETFIKQNEEKINSEPKIQKFLSRYNHFPLIMSEVFMLLERFDQVIYMESDFVVLSDISDFKEINTVAWRGGAIPDYYKGHKLNRPNGGFYVFPNSLPYEKCADKYVDYFFQSKFSEHAMARLMFDLNIEVTNLGYENNFTPGTLEMLDSNTEIKCFHASGLEKMWNCGFMRFLFPEYNRYYKYFGFECNNDKRLFSSRTEFIKHNLRTEIWRRYLFRGSLNNKYVRIEPATIFKNELQYYYKECQNIKFRIKYISFGCCRIYFQMMDEQVYKMTEYIRSRKDIENYLLPYKFYAYNVNTKVFFRDVKCKELLSRFNEMVDLFTRIVDDFFANDSSYNE